MELFSQGGKSYTFRQKNGAASARTSDPGASIGRVLGRTIQMRERISRRSRCRRSKCCEQLLKCCEEIFPCCEPSCSQHSTGDVGINVANLCVACYEQQGVQHLTSGVFLPLPPCRDYIVTMLRPVSRATSKHQEPNITCLQHQNSTSAILKMTVCNIQHQVSSSPPRYSTSHICNMGP
jgi:hypothetical protein